MAKGTRKGQKIRKYYRVTSFTDYLTVLHLICENFYNHESKTKLSDISKTLRVTLPAVTHKVNDLVEKNYVEKETSPKDLRVTYIRLTQTGKEYVESIREEYYQPLREVVKYLGDDDTKCLMRILDKISLMGKTKK